MSADRFLLFVTDCPAGCSVSITLADGDIIAGTLLSIDTETQSLKIQAEDGIETFFGDELKRWKILTTNPTMSVPSQIETLLPSIPLQKGESQPVVEEPVAPLVVEEVAEEKKETEPQKPQEQTDDVDIERQFQKFQNIANMTFGGEMDFVPLPEPVFVLPQEVIDKKRMSNADIETIRNKSKSKFDNAVKNHDVSKIREILFSVKDIESRYEQYRIAILPQLCGLLSLKIDPYTNRQVGYDYLKKSLDWEQNNSVSLQGFVHVTMQQKKWKEAGECLMRMLLARDVIGEESVSSVKALGCCLLNLSDEIPALMLLKDKMQITPNFLPYLLFLAVAGKSHKAAVLAGNENYAEAKKLLPDAVAFQSAAMLYNAEQSVIPDPELEESVQNENYNVLTGTVIFYPDRQCGFINNTIRNESFYFSAYAISDEELRTALTTGLTKDILNMVENCDIHHCLPLENNGYRFTKRTIFNRNEYIRDIRVSFEDTGYRPWNQTWNQAQNVRFASDMERQRVLDKLSVKSGKKDTPLDIRLKAIPKDGSSFAKAKIAEQLGDLEKQEHELSKTISLGLHNRTPRAASAVLDLAGLYNRQNKADEALKLLDDYQSILFTSSDKERLDNVRVSILTKAKRYGDVLELVKQMIQRTRQTKQTAPRFAVLQQQQAFCLMMLAYERRDESILTKELPDIQKYLSGWKSVTQVENSLRAINEMPHKLAELLNPQNADMSEKEIQETIGDNVFSEIDEVKLPIVAQYLLEHNKLENVDQRVRDLFYKQDKNISESDLRKEIDKLREQLDISGKRPIQKFGLHLTIATIYWRCRNLIKGDEIHNHTYKALSFYGEGFVYEKEMETARVGLMEALSIPADYTISFTSGMLIISYLQQTPDAKEIVQKQSSDQFLDYALALLDRDEKACEEFAKNFPYFMCRFLDKSKQLLDKIRTKQKVNLLRYFSEDFEPKRKVEQRRIRDEKEQLETLIKNDYRAASHLSEHFAVLRALANNTVFTLDKERLDRIAEIAERLPEIERQSAFLLAERLINETETSTKNLKAEIEKRPTSLSLQYVLDLLDIIDRKIKELKQSKQEKSAPLLRIINLLENDNYVLEGTRVKLQLKVELQEGSAPIEQLEVKIDKTDGLSFELSMGLSPEQLRDGTDRSLQIDIIPTQKQIESEAFDVQLLVAYINIATGERCETAKQTFPVRLGQPGEPIANPYDVSGRTPVSAPEKFVGRKEVIDEVVTQMTQAELGKCYVLFGQMRCGKSSTMKQIQQKITKPCLTVYTDASGGESEGSQSMNFSLMIRDSLRKALSQALTGKEMDLSLLKEFKEYFSDESLLNSPVQSFSTMIDYAKAKLEENDWNNPRIVLLIDEFTYIYQNIISKKIDGSVMKHWKAMLQNEGFSAVLVGQDTMMDCRDC